MRTFVTLFAAAALIAAPTIAAAAGSAPVPAAQGRAGADLKEANGIGGKTWLGILAVASMAGLAVLISHKSVSP